MAKMPERFAARLSLWDTSGLSWFLIRLKTQYACTEIPSYSYPLENLKRQPVIPIALSNPYDDARQFHTTFALIDTGADMSIIPSSVGRDLLHNNFHPEVEKRTIYGIGGEVQTFLHTFDLDVLDLDGNVLFRKSGMKIEVSEEECGQVILGMRDFITRYVTKIDFSQNSLFIKW